MLRQSQAEGSGPPTPDTVVSCPPEPQTTDSSSRAARRSRTRRGIPRLFGLVWLLATLAVLSGCTEGEPRRDSGPAPADAQGGVAEDEVARPSPANDDESPPAAEGELLDDYWLAYYMQGSKVGHGRTTVRRLSTADLADTEPESGPGPSNEPDSAAAAAVDGPVLEIEAVNKLAVTRFGQQTEQEITMRTLETPEGELLRFESRMELGPMPLETRGWVEGDRLVIETTTQGKTVQNAIPWKEDYGGFAAVELSLERDPLEPGRTRSLRALQPGFYEAALVELKAEDFESVELLSGTYELLRVATKTTFANGNSLGGIMWIDRTGKVLKHYTDAMNLEAYRTTKARALDDTEAVELDLGWDFSVPVDRRLTNPSSSRQIRYRVQLEDSDPAAVFVSGPTQQVRPVDDHTAEIVVTAVRPAPDDSQAADDTQSPAHDRPTSADLEPNSLIQSDDPAIVAMAEEAAGEATDPWQAALAFERYVSEHISSKGFSQAFATAAEVAKTKSGDCTEHAVLLAALARARGIPARVAVGLVYMPGAQAMGYHMWNELYVEGRWIPMDATLARGGTGAARLKLAHSNLEGTSAYASFLPAVQIVGRLKVEILDVE